MKNLLFRVLAFALDLALVSIMILGISMISFINPNGSQLNKQYRTYYYQKKVYENMSNKFDEYFEDKIISEDELEKVSIFYKDYLNCFDDIEVGVEIKEKEISAIRKKIEEKHLDISNNLIISINKLNIREVLISLIVYILYFGVLQYVLNGQTPFKRVFRIKVTSVDNNKKVSLISFIIRAVLVTEVILSLTDILLLVTLKSESYMVMSYWVTQVKYIYEMGFLVCMIIRDDARSIDDLLLKTRVFRYDKNMKEIIDPLFVERIEEND